MGVATAVLCHYMLGKEAIHLLVGLAGSDIANEFEFRMQTKDLQVDKNHSIQDLIKEDEDEIEARQQGSVHLKILRHCLGLVVVPADRISCMGG